MSNYAIIDIGTNSIKFLVFSLFKNKLKILIDTHAISRLGENTFKTGKITMNAISRNVSELRKFKKIAQTYNVKKIIVVGTMCLRAAKNSNIFVKEVYDKLALSIKILKGEEEARLSYLAALSNLPSNAQNIMVFDTGGGSTELIFGNKNELENIVSLNIGAVHLTEKFLRSDPVKNKELQNSLKNANVNFKKHLEDKNVNNLIGIGGTVTTLAAIKHKMKKYDATKIEGTQLSRSDLDKSIKMFQRRSIEERKKIPGLEPRRADVILAGAVIVKTILGILNEESFSITNKGLRHGIMYDFISNLK